MYVRRWNVLCHFINNFSEWCSHSIFTYLNYIPYDVRFVMNSTSFFFFRIFNRKNAIYWWKKYYICSVTNEISLSFICVFRERYTDFFIKFFIFSWLFESWLIFIYRSERKAIRRWKSFFFCKFHCFSTVHFSFKMKWNTELNKIFI